MTASCTVCGEQIEPGAKFCRHCGASLKTRPRNSRRGLWVLVALFVIAAASGALWFRSYLGPSAAVTGQWRGVVAVLPPDAGAYANASSVDITISRIGQGGSLIGSVTIGSAVSPLSGRIRGRHVAIVADFSPASVGGPHPKLALDGTVDGDVIETRTTLTAGGTEPTANTLIDAPVTLLRTTFRPAPATSSPLAAAHDADTSEPFSLRQPVQRFPADGAIFQFYPRILDLTWDPVLSAVRYRVEAQFGNGPNRDSQTWTSMWIRDAAENRLRMSFVGAQWGRWRVWAINANGEESSSSDWSFFYFTR